MVWEKWAADKEITALRSTKRLQWSAGHSGTVHVNPAPYRDRREYRYRIETIDTKPLGISIGLDRAFFWVSVSVPVSIQRIVHFLQALGRILIK